MARHNGRDVHEGNFDSICKLCHQRAFREKPKQLLADTVGYGCNEDAERAHLRREQQKRECVTCMVVSLLQNVEDV